MPLAPRLRAAALAAVLGLALLSVPARAADPLPSAGTGLTSPAPDAVAERVGRRCANGRPTRIFRDPRTDGPRGVEADGLGVWNKDRDQCYWFTVTGRFRAAKAQVVRVVIDSDRRYRGYEHEAWFYSPKDGDDRRGAFLIEHYDDGTSQYVDCPVNGSFLLRVGQIRIGFPKTCLGSPAHIRAQVSVIDITRYLSGNRYRGVADFVPDGRYTPLY
ncbi:hypothetical protein [Nocardioides dongxiaopingii]|uniref:hypothetical protein n=1 Tax=Nocardioides dongxiaopingii TaxID=2576036 RepID=UPI0010C765DF|nr:hypothetical protein [Nocardioides dongxiaopingii]